MSDDETLQHIKDVELLILKDFIDICDENNIDYYLFFGAIPLQALFILWYFRHKKVLK